MTAAQNSLIHAFADCIVTIDAPTPKIDEVHAFQASILPMGSLFEQALGLLLDLFILMLMRDLDLDSGQMFSRHANLE
jgi:6-phospho-3-hexuloisomerase